MDHVDWWSGGGAGHLHVLHNIPHVSASALSISFSPYLSCVRAFVVWNVVDPISDLLFQTDIEITREEDFTHILQMEENYIQQICEDIIRLKPDLLFTEKGISGRVHST